MIGQIDLHEIWHRFKTEGFENLVELTMYWEATEISLQYA